MASITESTPGHYDVTIRDVGKFTSVVDEQTPGNDHDTMIINTDYMLEDSRSTRGPKFVLRKRRRQKKGI